MTKQCDHMKACKLGLSSSSPVLHTNSKQIQAKCPDAVYSLLQKKLLGLDGEHISMTLLPCLLHMFASHESALSTLDTMQQPEYS